MIAIGHSHYYYYNSSYFTALLAAAVDKTASKLPSNWLPAEK